MPKLPVISYRQLLKFLRQFGYEVDHQRGSHIRLKKESVSGNHSITVPAHKEIAKGTLSDILECVSPYIHLSKEQIVDELRDM